MNRVIGYVSIAIILILLAVSVFLISNTVTIGISVRKEEIGIMKLIGATNLFVRAPFLIEGILIGLVGAAIPLGLLYVVYNRVISYVMTEFSVLSNFMAFMPVSAVFRILLPVGLILGMGIGTCRQYLYDSKTLESLIGLDNIMSKNKSRNPSKDSGIFRLGGIFWKN